MGSIRKTAKVRPETGSYRITDATNRRPRSHGPFKPRYTLSQDLHGLVTAIARLDQELRGFTVDSETRRRIQRDALARNAFATASIEGNPLTLNDVESLLQRGPTPANTVEPEEREILNYAALVATLPDLPPPRTIDDVNRLHREYFEGVLSERGALKTRPNFIGSKRDRIVIYLPTAPADTQRELLTLLEWAHDAPEQPLIRAAVFFHEFQSIHPYLDGNGRLGRLLNMIFLWHWGHPGVAFAPFDYGVNEDREGYYAALAASQGGDWDRTPWIRFYLHVLHGAYETVLHRLLTLEQAPPHLNERQRRLLEWFARLGHRAPGRRVKFADVHAAFPQVPGRTVTHDLGVLAATGLVKQEGERRHTTYRFAGAGQRAPART